LPVANGGTLDERIPLPEEYLLITVDTIKAVAEERRARIEAARSITDPLERAVAANDVAVSTKHEADTIRRLRDQAACALFVVHEVRPPVLIYRRLDMARSGFHRAVERSWKRHVENKAPLPQEFIDDPAAAWGYIDQTRGVVEVLDHVAEEAREVRDPVIAEEIPGVISADVARSTGLTTARIAQLRRHDDEAESVPA
jgi:hypothetical protein